MSVYECVRESGKYVGVRERRESMNVTVSMRMYESISVYVCTNVRLFKKSINV